MALSQVIGLRYDGLGARLVSISNTLYLSRHLKCEARFYWFPTDQIAGIADWRYLFDENRQSPGFFTNLVWDVFMPPSPRSAYFGAGLTVVDRSKLEGFDDLVHYGSYWVSFPERTHQANRVGLKNASDEIAPCGEVLADFSERYSGADLSDSIGVHVRRGDLLSIDDPHHRARFVGLEEYFFMLDHLLADETIFLCTEDTEIIASFVGRYGARVTASNTTDFRRDSPSAVRLAFADILALSKCRIILGGVSAFNRAAGAFGGQPLLMLLDGEGQRARNIQRARNELLRMGFGELAGRLPLPAVPAGQAPPAESRHSDRPAEGT